MKKIFLLFYRIIKKFLPQKLNYFIWDIYLINIDVEGIDELIKNSIDFNKYQPRMIVYESFNPFSSSKTKEILDINSYTLLFISGGFIGYVRRVSL